VKKLNSQNIIIIIIIIIIWKLILSVNFPFVNSDGPWILSDLFSFIAGNSNSSTFAFDFYGNTFKDHVLELILYPFYRLLPTNTYTFIGVTFFFIISTIFLMYFIFHEKQNGTHLFCLASLGFLTSTYTYNGRYENYIIPILMSMVFLFNSYNIKNSLFYLGTIALLCSIATFIHPVGSIVAVFLVLIHLMRDEHYIKIGSILLILGILFSLLITWGEVQSYINYFLKIRQSNDDHYFSLMGFAKYLTFSLGIVPLFILAIKINTIKNIIPVIIIILILANFGRSYYFHYLFVILVSIISNPISKGSHYFHFNNKEIYKYFSIVCIVSSMFFCHFNPTILSLENRALGKNFRQILSKVNSIGKKQNTSNLLWVPAQFGMEVIDQPNSRLWFHFYKTLAHEKIKLYPGDAMLFYSKRTMNRVLRGQVYNPKKQLLIENLYKPFPRELRIGTFYKERADSVGLWQVMLKSKYGIENN